MNPNAPRKAWLAFIVSLILPGAGQVYNGKLAKAAMAALFVSVIGYLIYTPVPLLGFEFFALAILLRIAAHALIAFDAWLGAKPGRAGPRQRWYMYFALIGFYVFLSIPGLFLPVRAKTFRIPSASMAPTVLDGDFIVTDLAAFKQEPPQAGDLAAFSYPKDESVVYLSRVVAGPEETVEFRDKKLILNRQKIAANPVADPGLKNLLSNTEDRIVLEPFMEEFPNAPHMIFLNPNSSLNSGFGPVKIPENSFFALGDNRDRASDSRTWGFVPRENFLAKPLFVYFSIDPVAGKIRWERIGLRLR